MVKILKTHPFFSFLSDQTIYLIAYELIRVRKFQPGELIMHQSKRSILNFHYKEFFEHRMSNLQEALVDQRNQIKAQEEEGQISMFQFMMDKLKRTITQK